ncbi:LysR family transcriptional regulator [Rhizobium terrae]|uniref:LysR family transcriptional regulator n=1 Tax=Rhizobium terrae TaxID=2171756 RepID=UPI000E3CD99D|nr:LysR family transcriptional regulator [Rhizobium terrae]
MNLRFIETFLWVARLGSFSAAADRLGATQASVSHRIATLEEELGVALFDRDSRSVVLTSIGQQAIPRAEEILRAVASFRVAITEPGQIQGSVSLGTNDVVAHSLLSRIIARVRQRYPGIVIDLQIETSSANARALLDRRIDMALGMGAIEDARIINREYGVFESVWAASPDFSLPEGRLSLADLAGRPLLTFSRDSEPCRALMKQFSDAGLRASSISNVNALITMIDLAVEGFGATALPHAVLRKHLESGLLRILDVDPPFPIFRHYLSYLDLSENPLVKAVAGIALQVAAEVDEEDLFFRAGTEVSP